MDLAGAYGWRGQRCWEQLKPLMPAAGVGVCFGALSFHLLLDNALRIMIGLRFGTQWWIQHLGLVQSVEQDVHRVWHTSYWSMIAGFTSLTMHAGGTSTPDCVVASKA